MLLLAYKYADDLGEALIVNANLGGDNCHRGALLGALLGAAGQELPPALKDGLPESAAMPETVSAYLGVVEKRGLGLVEALPPRPATAMESEASACKT